MRRLLGLFILALISFACKKNSDNVATGELNGRYRGTFNRSGDPDTAKISINFRPDMTFEGTGGPAYYPAICGGSFQQNNNTLVVNDTCAWTANFDWTLIFGGDYNISFSSGNSVRIWRTRGFIIDEYLLTRISR